MNRGAQGEAVLKIFHGGPSGLSSGGFILPPDETKVRSCSEIELPSGIGNPHRRDRVYVSSLFAAAEMFACMAPSPSVSVYEVEPIGELEPDPDCDDPTMSFQTTKAKIIRERRISLPRRRRILSALGVNANF